MFEYILMFLALCAVGRLGGRETMSAPSTQLNEASQLVCDQQRR